MHGTPSVVSAGAAGGRRILSAMTSTASRPLDTLIELQRALDELRQAEARLQGIPEWMAELHEEHSTHKDEMAALTADIDGAEAERRGAESAGYDLRERLRTYQEQIGQVRNQREYGALLKEIDATKQQIRETEEAALLALERQDETRKGLEERQSSFQELDQRYSVELEKWEAEKPQVAAEVDELKGRIETLREELPQPTLVLFDRIYERYSGRALTEIQKVERTGRQPQIYHCGTCNYRVRPQAVVEIVNHGKIVPCDSCKRILFFGEAPD